LNWTDFWNSALIGVIVGFGLVKGSDWLGRSRRQKVHKAAIAAEIEICREFAEIFLGEDPHVQSPSYRLSCITYSSSLPHLLADRALDRNETHALIRFFNQVETLNRGFDQANVALGIADNRERRRRLDQEDDRNKMKAKDLVENLYQPGRDVVAPIGRWAKKQS